MIKLIYGLPGTGKTTEISNQIKKSLDGKKKVLLIVPEQQTVEVERKMLKLLPPSVQLKFEVVNFSRLANKVFRKYGGLSYNYITAGMKNLFMKRTLLKLAPSLSEYQLRVRGDSSLPSLMLSQIDEFKANSINAEKLTLASKELKTKLTEKKLDNGSSLIAKLDDFGKIYAAYDEMVEKSYNDSANDLEELYKNTLKENNFFEGYDVYIDSFSSFTAAEHKIIEKIFEQADNTVISLPYTDTDPVPLHLKSVYETSVKLISASKKPPETLVLNTPFRASSPSLKMLWENLWNFAVTVKEDQKQKASDDSQKDAPPKLPADESIAIIECTDKYSESEAVTNIILKLLENGYRRREIAVIAGNMENYRGILDSTLEKANIPYFMSEKSSLLTSPLVSMMLSAFAIKQRNWRTDDVIAYLKSGLTDIDQNDIDVFEIYVSTWKIRGKRFLEDFWTMNPDGYSSKISERGLSILQTANEVKNKITLPLCEFFTHLDAAKNVADLCDATFEFFKKLNLSEKLLNCAKKAFFDNDKKSALEIAGSHKAFIKVLSDISATLGNQDMTVEEFASSLKLVLGNTDVGTIPTGADSIILGSASTLRASDIRCAILIGMCEGDFPASTSDCGFFSDNEKQKLKELKEKIDLSSDTKTQNSEELLYAYRAITLPSEKLFMLYNTGSGDNGAKKPSIAISRVLALLPDVKKVNYSLVEESDKLMSKALAFEALGRLTSDDNRDALYRIFESDPKYSDVMKKTSTPISASDCYINEKLAKSTFGDTLKTDQTQLEKYIKCHFAYYCDHVLKLRETEAAAFKYSDSGTFIHHILKTFMESVVDTDKNCIKRGLEDELKKIVTEEADAYIAKLFKDKYPPNERLIHLFDRLKRLSVIIAVDLYKEVCDGDFIPKFFEMYIENEIELNNDSKINFCGKIDRVDVYKKDGNVYVKIIDYKTGSKKFNIKDIEKGLNLQMLLYLFAICKSEKLKAKLGAAPANRKPAGITYISTNVSPQKTSRNIPEDKLIQIVSDEFTREGLILDDEKIITALNKNVDKRYLAGIERTSENTKPKGKGKDKDKEKKPFKGKALTSAERFDEIEKKIKTTLDDIVGEMYKGNASIAPMLDQKPCEYCKMKQFCRVELSDVQRIEEDDENENDD